MLLEAQLGVEEVSTDKVDGVPVELSDARHELVAFPERHPARWQSAFTFSLILSEHTSDRFEIEVFQRCPLLAEPNIVDLLHDIVRYLIELRP